MTLRERNAYFKIGIFIASVVIALLAVASFIIFGVKPPIYPEVLLEAHQRAVGLINSFLNPSPYAAFVSILLSSVYALVSILFIYYFFEKTQAPEILFIAFFVLSFAFESGRLMIPLKKVYDLPSIYLIMSDRAMLFGRYFGIFSLFTASLYASGLDIQKQNNNILILAAVSLVLALGIPIDGFTWNSNLIMTSGYPHLFNMAELSIALITLASFLISALSRGNKAYLLISLGALLALLGRNLLLNADTWATPFVGIALLGVGTWLICTKLHGVYLWL
jgi:hypothetical protein